MRTSSSDSVQESLSGELEILAYNSINGNATTTKMRIDGKEVEFPMQIENSLDGKFAVYEKNMKVKNFEYEPGDPIPNLSQGRTNWRETTITSTLKIKGHPKYTHIRGQSSNF